MRNVIERNYRKRYSSKGGLLNFVAPLMRVGLPFMKNNLRPLAKGVLRIDDSSVNNRPTIQKETFGGGMATLIISNAETKDIKIVKQLEEFGLLKKCVSKAIENKAKKGGFSAC